MTTTYDTAECLSDELLERHHAREVSESQSEAIQRHLAQCPRCAARAREQLQFHESWVDRLRIAGLPPANARTSRIEARLDSDDVPGYRIESEIARGGQGVVYRGGPVNDATRRRFQREIELLARLQHPNIITAFDAGLTRDGRAYFAMEYLEGKSFSHWVRPPDGKPRDRELTLKTFVKVCQAVAHAHKLGIIHRDLKPSNVLVDPSGEPHVLDFGLARLTEDAGASQTSMMHVAGTLAYMSPEQARALPDAADVRSDVYSLGVMLYEALTAALPYSIESDTVAALRTIVETPPNPPSRTAADLDNELETIVLKSLAKERERRYQGAGELATDIEHYLAGEPIEARRDSAAYLLRKTLQRHRGLFTLTAVFMAALGVLSVVLALAYAEQRRQRTIAEERYRQVRELARTFIFEFDPKISRLPGTAEARRLIVEKGLAYLDSLSREGGSDAELEREIAAAYATIGDIQCDITTSNLGNAAAGMDSYRKAIALYEHHSHDPEVRLKLVPIRLRVGDLLGGLAKADDALAQYQTALDEGAALLAARPDDDASLDAVADARERLGNHFSGRGQLDVAAQHYAVAAEIAGRRAAEKPDDLWLQRDLGVALTKQARIAYARDQKPDALALYRRFTELAERLLQAHPNDLVARRDTATGLQWIGILLLETDAAKDAVTPLQRSVDIFTALHELERDNVDAALSLCTSLTRLGEVHRAIDSLADCESAFRRNLEISRRVQERLPEDATVARQYGVALYKMYELEQSAARRPDDAPDAKKHAQRQACDWLGQCLKWFEKRAEEKRLPESDAAIPGELRSELEACRRQLDSSATSQAIETPPAAGRPDP